MGQKHIARIMRIQGGEGIEEFLTSWQGPKYIITVSEWG